MGTILYYSDVKLQGRIVFNEMNWRKTSLWENSAIIRLMCSNMHGPKVITISAVPIS